MSETISILKLVILRTVRRKARTIEKRRTGKDFVRDRSFEMHEMEKTKGTERNSMKKG